MSLVKKWLGCVLSFVLGVCGLAFSACSGMIVERTLDTTALGGAVSKTSATTKAFKVITDGDLLKESKVMGVKAEFVTMKVFAIIALVLAVLLIAYSVVLLLKNLNVIKLNSKVFDIITISLIGLTLVSVISLMISSCVYAGAVKDYIIGVLKPMAAAYDGKLKYNVDVTVGLYQPIMLGVSIVVTLLVLANQIFNKKKA